ncbi:hypothetical protein H310_08423 [Aphanomyces invadans]|uniref:Magnesium transporter n=1 Tax=Aphanomyces invadans TaxID=157072 RepID=A0A024TZ94_9STRA|nr:hypothetical protein H310_08423 [Aphanomyces invadans]ETV98936.1 hypothetical protein H310_08423 [Aphanomyces invadans]|eukprot:XP_008872364.1 hypothetical protein H310_08423 [Aphanomyces invadans]
MGCEERSTQTYSLWYVGVIMSVGASVCTNMGVNLQKYSFMRECKKPTATKRGYIRQPLWMLGLWLVIFGSLGDFGALGFIPQSLATPVGGSTIVANVFFAHKFLHEVFTRRDGIGTALILTGIVVVAAFADKSNGCHTLDQLIALYGQPAFIAYVVLVSVTMAVVYIFVRRIRSIVATCGKNSKQYRRFVTFHSLANPALSGVFGAQSVLLAKSVAELIKSTIAGDNQFTTVGTYAIALGMFGCIFLQIHWLAQGLEHFDAVFVVPIFQCVFISTSILGGAVYFGEFATMSTTTIIMFLVGVVITLSGVGILSQRDMASLKPKQKLRACVYMVIFMKRTQKCKGLKYQWVALSSLEQNVKQAAMKSTLSLSKLKSSSIHPIHVSTTPSDAGFQLNVSASTK